MCDEDGLERDVEDLDRDDGSALACLDRGKDVQSKSHEHGEGPSRCKDCATLDWEKNFGRWDEGKVVEKKRKTTVGTVGLGALWCE